jgi:hypothetical protein
METICFSGTLTSTDESTRRQNPEDQHHHPHRRETSNLSIKITFNYLEIRKTYGKKQFGRKFCNLFFSRTLLETLFAQMNI